MTEYQCTKCKYKFDKKEQPKRCPYCSKEGSVEEVMNAQDILDEVQTEKDMLDKDLG